jgi:alpha-tubulin suppressor-like RCC1 family protein
VAAGQFSFAIDDLDQKLYAWGEPDFGRTPTIFLGDKRFKAISASSHALAVDTNGKVWGTGANNSGQLGNETTIDHSGGGFVQASGIGNVVEVAAGAHHSLALKSDGTVMAWGRNTEGQLGDGTTTSRTTPVIVNGLTRIVAIAAGNDSSFAIKSLPSGGNTRYILYAWGLNYGNFGNGTNTGAIVPQHVLNDVKAVATSNCDRYTLGAHSLFLTEDGRIWASGYNSKGQLGDGTFTDRVSPVAVPI